MKFLIDNRLPRRLAGSLVERGHDAVHVLDVGLGGAEDRELWERAAREGRVIVSEDEDFVELALLDPRPVPVVHVCLGNCRNPALLAASSRALAGPDRAD